MVALTQDLSDERAGVRSGRILRLLTFAVAIGIGLWLAATAVYRADDFALLAEGWEGGSVRDALARWSDRHLQPRDDPRWPKFYRPVWHGLYVVDAHVFGCRAGLSAALSWSLHVAVAWVAGRIVWCLTRSTTCRWLTTWICLLAASGLQATVWIAARGTTLATLFVLLGILVAITMRRATGMRLAMLCLCIVLAAGSNEVGVLAGPLIAWAVLVLPRTDTVGPPRRAIWVTVFTATCAWMLWRRFVLGCWVGGYPPAPSGDAIVVRVLTSLTSGTGSIALSNNGTAPLAAGCWLGGVVLGLLAIAAAVGERLGRGTRPLTLLTLGAVVVLLLPFAQHAFGDTDGTAGRCLYPAHAAWSMGTALLLTGSNAGRWRWLRRGLAAVVVVAATLAFATALPGLDRALQTARALFAAVATFGAGEPVVLFGMPDRIGSVVVARNAFPPAAAPPFCPGPTGVVGHATDDDLASGRVVGLALALPHMPDVAAHWWEPGARRFVPGEWPTDVAWRGTITVAADGTVACSGVRLVDAPGGGIVPHLSPGTWYELRGAMQPAAVVRELVVREALPWTPMLQPAPDPAAGARWRYQGRPEEYLFLLLGDDPCVVSLGVAGTLGIATPSHVLVGATDASGALDASLPIEHVGVRLVQPLVVRGPQVLLGELHQLR